MQRWLLIYFLAFSLPGYTQRKNLGADSICTWGDYSKLLSATDKLMVCHFLVLPDETTPYPCDILQHLVILKQHEWDRNKEGSFDSVLHDKMNDIWFTEFGKEYKPSAYITRKELGLFIKYITDKGIKRRLKRYYNWPDALLGG